MAEPGLLEKRFAGVTADRLPLMSFAIIISKAVDATVCWKFRFRSIPVMNAPSSHWHDVAKSPPTS